MIVVNATSAAAAAAAAHQEYRVIDRLGEVLHSKQSAIGSGRQRPVTEHIRAATKGFFFDSDQRHTAPL